MASCEELKTALLKELLEVFRLQDCGEGCVSIAPTSEFFCCVEGLGLDFEGLRWRLASMPEYQVEVCGTVEPGEARGANTWYSASITLESY
jgi:hypothetical protein